MATVTRQNKIKAGTVTPEMQRRCAKEIRLAKLDEFKSYRDNGALRAWRTSANCLGTSIPLLVVGF